MLDFYAVPASIACLYDTIVWHHCKFISAAKSIEYGCNREANFPLRAAPQQTGAGSWGGGAPNGTQHQHGRGPGHRKAQLPLRSPLHLSSQQCCVPYSIGPWLLQLSSGRKAARTSHCVDDLPNMVPVEQFVELRLGNRSITSSPQGGGELDSRRLSAIKLSDREPHDANPSSVHPQESCGAKSLSGRAPHRLEN